MPLSAIKQRTLYGRPAMSPRNSNSFAASPAVRRVPPAVPHRVARSPHPAHPSVGMRSPVSLRLSRLHQPGAVDYPLLLLVIALLLLGLVMVYSASQFAVPGDTAYWFKRQAVWALLGGVALLVASRLDYHLWRRLALPGMVIALLLLLVVLKVGHTAYGAQRWLHLGLFSFQPSEITKLALTIYVADWLVRAGDGVKTLRNGLLPFATLTGVVLALILFQNDMGTSLVVGALALAMFFAAGANLLQLVPTLALGGLAFWIVTMRTGFRRARLEAFLHPLPPSCADAASYQVCQGLISLGSGGLFGRGLGDSVQKAGYLPNPFTDSIFAVTGEELGLIGCALIIGLFVLLAFRGLRIGRRSPDAYGALLACGITCWLVTQAAINIGSVVDAIPFTGVPLPFVSFGGSSLVTSLAAIGVLLNISRHAQAPES
ncbi:MAG: putative lipid II flippase FtsW [Ktedonobacterales bacterium]